MLVALYARVSTTRQAENDLSIPDQLRQLRDWCTANGHGIVREFVEPGASATDDKRPIFQTMIADALTKPTPYDAIVIHSLSRFFRDGLEFGLYERKLGKNKVKVISITQPTTDDASGEMMRRIINLFDEHQSRENAKHTHRAMCENVRQGFFSGSRPPFGFKSIATDVSGSRGRKKKRLEIEPGEALIVRQIYDLYLNGFQGRTLGIKEIVKHLTQRGHMMRGQPWSIQKVHKILRSRSYLGEHQFNVRNSKTGEKRPPSEWLQTLKAEREALHIERAGAARAHAAPVEQILPRHIEAFSAAIRAKLKDAAFAKRYLHLLVDEIVVSGGEATMKGSYGTLARAVAGMKKGTSEEVPSFMFDWRARSDSNARPLGS